MRKTIFHLGFLLFAILESFTCLAQDVRKPMPSVWAWEIHGGNRVVYLLGELHDFTGPLDLKLDYKLGQDVYKKSTEFWIESEQNSGNVNGEKNENYFVWNRVRLVVGRNVDFIMAKKNQSERDRVYYEFLDKLNNQNAFGVYVGLQNLILIKKRFENPMKFLSRKGLSAVLIKSEKEEGKIFKLEIDSAISDSWHEYCNQNDFNFVIKSVLNDAEADVYPPESVQKIFFDENATLNELMFESLKNPASFVFEKCLINPRNKMWIPKMLSILRSKGEPVAFLVGIGHLWGDEGVINILKNNGFDKISRVYGVE
jgi:hypothetical protein